MSEKRLVGAIMRPSLDQIDEMVQHANRRQTFQAISQRRCASPWRLCVGSVENFFLLNVLFDQFVRFGAPPAAALKHPDWLVTRVEYYFVIVAEGPKPHRHLFFQKF